MLKSLSSLSPLASRLVASSLAASAAALLLLAGPATASASSLSFGSYLAGSNPSSFANTAMTYNGSSPVLYTDSTPTPILGTTFVSYTYRSNAPAGTVDYFTTYNGSLAGDTGSISVQADDVISVIVLLNGNTLGSFTSSDSIQAFTIAANDYINGVNTFEFEVDSSQGTTGVDFSATAVGSATVDATAPEPSSLVLLGTGILGLAGAARRRMLAV